MKAADTTATWRWGSLSQEKGSNKKHVSEERSIPKRPLCKIITLGVEVVQYLVPVGTDYGTSLEDSDEEILVSEGVPFGHGEQIMRRRDWARGKGQGTKELLCCLW